MNIDNRKINILLIDDEKTTLLLISDYLKSNDFTVFAFECSNKAYEFFSIRDSSIDIIISDISMPTLNGFELCRKIMSEKKHRHIPILLISGSTNVDTIVEGYDAGCFDFVPKPIDPHELLAKVNSAVKVVARQHHTQDKIKKTKAVAYDAMAAGSKISEIISITQNSGKIESFSRLAEVFFSALEKYEINASILFNGKMGEQFYSHKKLTNPLEQQMLVLVRDSHSKRDEGRFFEFKGRMFVVYDSSIVLIKNYTQINDPNLKDFIAALMNFVDNKALIISHEHTRKEERTVENKAVIAKFEESVHEIKGIFSSQMQSLNGIVDLIISELSVNFASLDIGEKNEEIICESVKHALGQLEESIHRGDALFNQTVDDVLVDLHEVLLKEIRP